jgi:hypothetical protein
VLLRLAFYLAARQSHNFEKKMTSYINVLAFDLDDLVLLDQLDQQAR